MHRKHTWITWERAPWAGVSGTSSWIAPGAPLAWRKWSLSRTITVGLVLAKFVPLFFKKKMCAFFILISFQTTGVRSLATRRSLASDFSQFYSMCSSCGSTIFYTGKKKIGIPVSFFFILLSFRLPCRNSLPHEELINDEEVGNEEDTNSLASRISQWERKLLSDQLPPSSVIRVPDRKMDEQLCKFERREKMKPKVINY